MRRPPVPALATAVAIAILAGAPARGGVLEANRSDLSVGVSVGGGYSSVAPASSGGDYAYVQAGARGLLWSRFEGALDLRATFAAAAGAASAAESYSALLRIVGYIDLVALTPFVGILGGVSVSHAFEALTPEVGACAGLALWFAATWRLSLGAAQRWIFHERGALATDVELSAEWFI